MTQTLFGVSHYVGQTLNLEANREVNEVKVQVVQLEGSQRLVQAHRDVFWGVKGTPQLADTNRKHNNIISNENEEQKRGNDRKPPAVTALLSPY